MSSKKNARNRSFIGAILETVKALCLSLIGGLEVVDDSIAMAGKAVKVARRKQAVELDVDMSHFATNLTARATMEQSRLQEAMDEYMMADPTGKRAQRIKENSERISKIVQQSLAEIDADDNE